MTLSYGNEWLFFLSVEFSLSGIPYLYCKLHNIRTLSMLSGSPRVCVCVCVCVVCVVCVYVCMCVCVCVCVLCVCMCAIGHQSLTSGMELRKNILVSGNADSTVKVRTCLCMVHSESAMHQVLFELSVMEIPSQCVYTYM